MNIKNLANMSEVELAVLSAELGKLESLADVVRWAGAKSGPLASAALIADVVTQDEFTHDVVVAWQNGGAIVFGST